MKSFRKVLSIFLAALLCLGALGVAGVVADTVDYGGIVMVGRGIAVRVTDPNVPDYGTFFFEAPVPVEVPISTYIWDITVADVATVDGVTTYSYTGVQAQIPDGVRTQVKNRLTINLNYGDYYFEFTTKNTDLDAQVVTHIAPQLIHIANPGDITNLKNLHEKKAVAALETDYTPESWALFVPVRDKVQASLKDYTLTADDIAELELELQAALDGLVRTSGAKTDSVAGFFQLLMQIVQYFFFIKQDTDLGTLFNQLKNVLFNIGA
ncbi:MAG: hypothetical protein LBN05_02930 [Oscillospiraceae bacterium]|nr:hypothetical protein [Oscillospiraceae bacterium]